MLSFLLLFLYLIGFIECTDSYIYFIGQGSDLDSCKEAQTKIEDDKVTNCPLYSSTYHLDCSKDFVFVCGDPDSDFTDVPSNTETLKIMVALNTTTIDLSKLPKVSKIKMQPLDESSLKTVLLKGCQVHANSVEFNSLNISVFGGVMTINELTLSFSILVSDDSIRCTNLYADEFFFEHMEPNTNVHGMIYNNYYADSCNLTITFTENNWTIIEQVKKSADQPYVERKRFIPYSIADMIHFIYEGENVTFNIDDPSTASLKKVQLYTNQNSMSLISTGSWSDPLTGKLELELINFQDYNTDLLEVDWFQITVTPISSSGGSSSGSKPENKYITYNIFIGQGEEYTKCNEDKQKIEDSEDNCKNLGGPYFIFCSNDYRFVCSEDDSILSQIPKDDDPDKQSRLYIIIGSNSPKVDLSLIQTNMPFAIYPKLNSVEDDNPEVTNTLTLKGCNLERFFYISYLKIKIVDSDFSINYIWFNHCELLESEYFLNIQSLNADTHFIETLPTNYKLKVNLFRPDSPDAPNYYYNLTVLFTENKWILSGYTLKNDIYTSIETEVPYSIASILDISTYSENATFAINDPSKTVLKPIDIEIENNIGKFTFFLAGDWSSLSNTPLNVSLNRNSNFKYNVEALDRDLVRFEPDIYSPSTISSSSDSNDGEGGDDEGDASSSEPEHDTNRPTNSYIGFIIIADNNQICEDFKNQFSGIFQNIMCSNSQKINNDLASISEETGVLFIEIHDDIPEIDFNQLKNPKDVAMTSNLNFGDDELKLLQNENPLKKILLKKKKLNLKEESEKKINVGICGNIRDKVSYMLIDKISLEVKKDPINVLNLELDDSDINANSKPIRVTHLVVTQYSHQSIIEKSQSKVRVSQYAIKVDTNIDGNMGYRISFGQDRWTISKGNDNNFGPIFEDYKDLSYVPYNLCDRVALIAYSFHFDLHVENSGITNTKAVNITLYNYGDEYEVRLLDDQKLKVNITTSGNWDGISNSVSVFFTYSQEHIDLDKSGCNSKVQIRTFDFSDLPTDGIPSDPIDDDTKKDNTEIGNVTISAGSKPEDVKNNIEKLFNETKSEDGKLDHVVTIISKEENQEIEFKDLTLEQNQFVKVNNDANVKLTSGQLNLVLDSTSSKVNIKVENSNNVQLKIKNMDECTVKIDNENSESKTVSIKSVSEVYGPLNLEAGENVEKIEIDSINLHDSGSVSSTVPVKVTNLDAQPQTTGKLSKVTVSEKISISQSAVLELGDDVSLSSASLNLNLHTYKASNFNKPILKGNLGEPPKEITLTKQEDDSFVGDQKCLLFQGTFANTCEGWKNRIKYDGTQFNDGVCQNLDGLRILEEKKSLLVYHNKDKDNGGNQNNGSKLSGGQIAGIVIGCILGVAIIVIVIVVVIKKKNNAAKSSAESDGEKQVDL